MANVRFYKLATLPSFDGNKHKGIFVHVTSQLTRTLITEGTYSYEWGGLKSEVIQKIVIQKIGQESVVVPKWMELRRIDKIESGLWFGGENGWELLSNDTTSGAIDAAIVAKIQELHVDGYAQATITPNTDSSTLTIKGIKEADGKIGTSEESKNLNIAIDGAYNESTNKIATQTTVTTTVTNAINGLDANTVQAVTFNTSEVNGNTTLTFNGVKEVNGKIYQGDDANPSTLVVGDAKLKIQIGSATIENVFSANAQVDSTIQLNGDVFKKDENNIISVITKNNDVSSSNPLVTQNDINGLAGAMHYRGGVTGLPSANENTKQGDVWIVTTAFVNNTESYEVGDMFIARADGASATFDTVQGNLTLGTGIGKVAANTEGLTDGNLVVATGTGIKTTNISATVLDEINNTRNLTYGSVAGGISITDSLKIMNRDFNESINITSTNRSIEIAKKTVDGVDTGVVLDLVWNTTIE